MRKRIQSREERVSSIKLFRTFLRWFNLFVLTSVLSLALAPGTATASPVYLYQSFELHGLMNLRGMNNSGQIIGHSWDGSSHAYILSAQGVLTCVDTPGSSGGDCYAMSINDSGEVLVRDSAGLHLRHADGTFDEATHPGTFILQSLNNSQTVAGLTHLADGYSVVMGNFHSSSLATIPLPSLGYIRYSTVGLNDNGDVVGSFNRPTPFSPTRGFLRRSDGTIVEGSSGDEYIAVNNDELILGTNNLGVSAFVLDPSGAYTYLDLPWATEQMLADGINDLGQVVGRYTDTVNYREHGFIATPTPDPEALHLLLVGLAGLIARPRRDRA
jgi:hypothetical protein